MHCNTVCEVRNCRIDVRRPVAVTDNGKMDIVRPRDWLNEIFSSPVFCPCFLASHSSLEANSWRCLSWPVGFLGCSWGALLRIAAWCSVMGNSRGKHARDPHCIACIDHWDKKIYGFLKNCTWRISDNASHIVWYIYPVWSVWQRQCVSALTVPVGKITEENGRSRPVFWSDTRLESSTEDGHWLNLRKSPSLKGTVSPD